MDEPISREIAERDLPKAWPAQPKSPMESDIQRDIEYGSTVAAITKERDQAQAEIKRLHGIIAKAREDFEAINEKAGELAEGLQKLKGMM